MKWRYTETPMFFFLSGSYLQYNNLFCQRAMDLMTHPNPGGECWHFHGDTISAFSSHCRMCGRPPTSPGVPGPAEVDLHTSAFHLLQCWPASSPRCEQSTRTLWRRFPPSSAAPPEWARGLEGQTYSSIFKVLFYQNKIQNPKLSSSAFEKMDLIVGV